MRDAPRPLDLAERRLERRAVGDVDPPDARGVALHAVGRVRDVEDRHLRAALGERRRVCRPELAEAAGDDDDAARDVEQRVGHRFASQTASQNSRTQPSPPARVSTQRASGTTSGHASAGTTGSPTAPRHAASLTSFPT